MTSLIVFRVALYHVEIVDACELRRVERRVGHYKSEAKVECLLLLHYFYR